MSTLICIVCGNEASLLCSACRTVCYCSKEHQKSHWKEHKVNCTGKTYEVKWDDNIGHHLVALKDLEAGTLILQEQPLVMAGKPRKSEDKKVCLGCYQKLDEGRRGKQCPGCKWPMCGKKECWQEGSAHALGECDLLKEARPANYLDLWEPANVYNSITVLRVLSLRERDPAKWKEIMNLKHGMSTSNLSAFESLTRLTVVPLVNQWFLKVAVPEEWIINIMNALTLNSISLLDNANVYSVASLFDHSCMANTEHTFTKSGKILVRSTVPISKGSKITLNYSKEPLLGTIKRLESLKNGRFIGFCQCQRCSDPSELGTFVSGIFCTVCPKQEGILLPENPLDPETSWACNKCSSKKSASFITNLLESVVHLGSNASGKVAECETFIRRYGKIFHPNHYFLTGVKKHLLFAMLHASSASELGTNHTFSVKEISERESGTQKLLALADVIAPGLSRLRGILLFSLASVQISRSINALQAGLRGDGRIPSNLDTIAMCKMTLETSREAYKSLFWGPEETIDPEHIFAEPAYKLAEKAEMIANRLSLYEKTGDATLFSSN